MRRILDDPHVDLAEPGSDRSDPRLGAGRKGAAYFEQAFVDLLAGKIDIGPIAEHRGHLREAVARQRAGVFEARGTGERGLDAEGELLFDFDGRERLRDWAVLQLVIGDVR